MLKCKLWIGKVKILSEEWRESDTTQLHQFGFYLQIIIIIKTEMNTCAWRY